MASQQTQTKFPCQIGSRGEPSGLVPVVDLTSPPWPPIELTWPIANDRKRAIVGKSPPRGGEGGRESYMHAPRIVPVLQRDMEMHYRSAGKGRRAAAEGGPPMQSTYIGGSLWQEIRAGLSAPAADTFPQ
jgi:hypothetical protein